MDYLFYQKKINDVIIKCPIEAGIEILVYNLLDECICAYSAKPAQPFQWNGALFRFNLNVVQID